MKWKPLILTSALAAILLGAVISFAVVGSWLRENRLTQQAKVIQVALEDYKQRHGSYPESFATARIQEPEEIFYTRKADGSYDLWYGMELGESVIFRPPEKTSQ